MRTARCDPAQQVLSEQDREDEIGIRKAWSPRQRQANLAAPEDEGMKGGIVSRTPIVRSTGMRSFRRERQKTAVRRRFRGCWGSTGFRRPAGGVASTGAALYSRGNRVDKPLSSHTASDTFTACSSRICPVRIRHPHRAVNEVDGNRDRDGA